MILANVKFGRAGKQSKSDLENLVETYLSRLLHQGQLGSEYIFAWTDGVLTAYVQLVAPDAHARRYHSDFGMKTLAELRKAFGENPKWTILRTIILSRLRRGGVRHSFVCTRTHSTMVHRSAGVIIGYPFLHISFPYLTKRGRVFIFGRMITVTMTIFGLVAELWRFPPIENWQTRIVTYPSTGVICVGRLKRLQASQRIIS